MIVKSMPGKVGRASFGKLVSYMLKPGRAEHLPAESLIKHNLWSDREDPESLIAELEENAAYQRRGVNRNLFYHEVISPHPDDGHLVTDDILHDLAWEYLARRAPEALALATIHRDIEDEERPPFAHLHFGQPHQVRPAATPVSPGVHHHPAGTGGNTARTISAVDPLLGFWPVPCPGF